MALVLVRPFYRIHYRGRGKLPKGAFILASNHISYFDPLSLGIGIRRRIFFMAKSELFTGHGIFASGFLKACGVFPVKRSSADKGSADIALRHLYKGRIVGIFPQGGIVRDSGSFRCKYLTAIFGRLPTHRGHAAAYSGVYIVETSSLRMVSTTFSTRNFTARLSKFSSITSPGFTS